MPSALSRFGLALSANYRVQVLLSHSSQVPALRPSVGVNPDEIRNLEGKMPRYGPHLTTGAVGPVGMKLPGYEGVEPSAVASGLDVGHPFGWVAFNAQIHVLPGRPSTLRPPTGPCQ